MTEDQPTTPQPPTPDELASAYVDGELTAAEVERVEGDTELLDRVIELRDVRFSTTDLPAVDPEQRRTHLAVAMSEFDRLFPDTTASATPVRDQPLVAGGMVVADEGAGPASGSDMPGCDMPGCDMPGSDMPGSDSAGSDSTRRPSADRWRGVAPRMLQLAAGVLLVAGIGFGISRMGSNSDEFADGGADSSDDSASDDTADADEAFDGGAESATASLAAASEAERGEEAGGVDEESADDAMAEAGDDEAGEDDASFEEVSGEIAPIAGLPLIPFPQPVAEQPGPDVAHVLLDQLVAEGIEGRPVTEGAVCEPLVEGGEYLGFVPIEGEIVPAVFGGQLHLFQLGESQLVESQLLAVVLDSACVELGRTG